MKKLLLSLLLACSSIYGEGFIAGTLVKTPKGYTAIDKLSVGDNIIAYDLKNRCVEKPVIALSSHYTNRLCELTLDDEIIIVDHDHKFYSPKHNTWIEASILQPGDLFLKNCTDLLPLDATRQINESILVYDLSVDDYHNFTVSKHDITVHNVLPLLAVGIVWTIGEGIAFYGGVGLGAAIVGGTIYATSKLKEKDDMWRRLEQSETATHKQTSYNNQETITHSNIDDTSGEKGIKGKIENLPTNKGDYPFIPKKLRKVIFYGIELAVLLIKKEILGFGILKNRNGMCK